MFEGVSDAALAAGVGLFGGVLLGLAARLGRFCTMGAIEDALYGHDLTRLRTWGLAIGLAAMGVFALVGVDVIPLSATVYHSLPWSPVATILGGLLFGYGMAIAGNCGFGALARLGGGDMRNFVIVLVVGISAYAVLSGPFAAARVAFEAATALPVSATPGYAGALSALTGAPLWATGMALGALICAAALSGGLVRKPKALATAFLVALAVVSGWGGTAWIATHGFDPQPILSHTFSSPVGETMLWVMTASGGGLGFAVGSVTGVLAGAFLGSLVKGHFRWEACEDPRELRRQIFGAALMGVGAVLAMGCTIGQGVSAFAVFAWSAPLVLAAIFVGAAFGLRQLISGFAPAE